MRTAAPPPCVAAWRAAASSRSASTTVAPSRAKRSAIARPMPDAAPVTRAAFPASRSVLFMDPPGVEGFVRRPELRVPALRLEVLSIEAAGSESPAPSYQPVDRLQRLPDDPGSETTGRRPL